MIVQAGATNTAVAATKASAPAMLPSGRPCRSCRWRRQGATRCRAEVEYLLGSGREGEVAGGLRGGGDCGDERGELGCGEEVGFAERFEAVCFEFAARGRRR